MMRTEQQASRDGTSQPARPRGRAAATERAEAAHHLKSLSKVTDILDCFSNTDRELSVTEIARRTAMPKSTAHRIIDSMRHCGLLEQNATRERYRLGIKLFEYGTTVLSSMDLHRIAGPFIQALTRRTGESGHLCVFNGSHMMLVKRVVRIASNHNTLTEMEESACYATGVGKATLAFQSEAVLQRIIDAGLVPFTRNTITDPARLRTELARVHAHGYAIDDCEHDADVRCVAAPIRNSAGRVFAAISLTGPARRMTLERLAALAPLVRDHAASISAQLGYTV
jgi:IclR family transcriptional regulator, KDG regulon repressor